MTRPRQPVRCTAKLQSGKRCKAWAVAGQTKCFMHSKDAGTAAKRSEARKRGAQAVNGDRKARRSKMLGGKPVRFTDANSVRSFAGTIATEFAAGRLSSHEAGTLIKVSRLALAALETGIRSREVEEFEQRLQKIEDLVAARENT